MEIKNTNSLNILANTNKKNPNSNYAAANWNLDFYFQASDWIFKNYLPLMLKSNKNLAVSRSESAEKPAT